jgi:hypothetical protein
MRPETAYRTALALIPVLTVLGIVAAIAGVWFVVVVMALALAGQLVSLQAARARLRGRR